MNNSNFDTKKIPGDWRFVPIRKGSKAPIGTAWQEKPFAWSDCPKPGESYQGQTVGAVGILFGHGGVVGLDFDGASVDLMLADWGVSVPETTVISSGRVGHCLKLFKIPEPYRNRVQTAKFKTGTVVHEYGKDVHEQLEIRWRGSQSLVYGTHPESGNQYKVLNWVDDLPELPAELLYRMLKPEEKNHKATDGDTRTEQQWALEYLEYIDPNPLDWYAWRDCLFACHAAGLSESEVRAWSSKSVKHTDQGFDAVWRHIKGKPGIGIGTLGWLAKQHGWEPKLKPKTNTADPPIDYQSYLRKLDFLKSLDNAVRRDWEIAQLSKKTGLSQTTINNHLKARNTTDDKQKPVPLSEFLDYSTEPLDWLVEGLLPVGETVLLTAAPKVGKTLLAVDLAYAVCTGTTVLKCQAKRGKVLFVSADESPNSTRLKLINRGFTSNMDMQIMTSLNLHDLQPLEKILQDYRPDLVIIDSLKATARDAAISENSAEFGNAIYDLKELLHRYRAGGILIHHAAKGRDRDSLEKVRGSSAITGAVWGVWQMQTGTDGTRHLQTTSRDIPGESMSIRLDEEIGSWVRLGDAPIQDGDTKERIVSLLKGYAPHGLEATEIQEKLSLPRGTVYTTLNRMVDKHLIGKRPNNIDGKRPVYFALPEPMLTSSTKSVPTACLQAPVVSKGVSIPNAEPEPLSETCKHSENIGVSILLTSGNNQQIKTTEEDRGDQKPATNNSLENVFAYISTKSVLTSMLTTELTEGVVSKGVSTQNPHQEPVSESCKHSGSAKENPMLTSQPPVQKPMLTACLQEDTATGEVMSLPKDRTNPNAGYGVHEAKNQLCVGDVVRYVGANQSLRVQCGHSRRDGVRVTAIEGELAFIKSPKWICDYRVAVTDLVKERSTLAAPAKNSVAVRGTDDDPPF